MERIAMTNKMGGGFTPPPTITLSFLNTRKFVIWCDILMRAETLYKGPRRASFLYAIDGK